MSVAGGETGRIAAPVGLLAELTHRCPLQCPYCSNPLALERAAGELPTEVWLDVLAQAADLGILQLHLSGGEPTVRRDLEDIVARAAKVGLYCNLITAGVLLTRERLVALAARGLDHVQISLQDIDAANADRIAHYQGSHAKKLQVARWVRALDMPLTLNVPIHRQNIASLPAFIGLAESLGAQRLEVAHVQYYGWALKNRQALMPTRDQVSRSADLVAQARERLKGILVIDFVVPDYYARRPKPCMGGWGRGIINITPSGRALPCHAAESLPGLVFDNVRSKSLRDIWRGSAAFQKYRGTDWMREPCRSCEFREQDRGGCRCQAFAFAGEASLADPACDKSPHHRAFTRTAAPSLAGQPELFLTNQMILMRERVRRSDVMEPFVRGLKDEEIIALAAHYAKLRPEPTTEAVDRAVVARGAELARQLHCGSCHRPIYDGQEQIPRLVPQRLDYLIKSLLEYRSGSRSGIDTSMNGVMYRVSDADVRALAHYLASLR